LVRKRGVTSQPANGNALARAIVKSAPALMLDKPTSALDAESERLGRQALGHTADQHTTTVIAHRLRHRRRHNWRSCKL
jgi:ABC-type multidrug transport system fused ATPase/permease subunit